MNETAVSSDFLEFHTWIRFRPAKERQYLWLWRSSLLRRRFFVWSRCISPPPPSPGERKGRWAMEQDFHGDFQVNGTWFFTSFSGVLGWIVLILVWFQRSLHSAQVKGQICPWPLRLMTSQTVERTWIRVGGYRRFSIKWPAYSTFIQRGYATRSHKPITVMSTKLVKRLSNRIVWNMQAILCLLHIRRVR